MTRIWIGLGALNGLIAVAAGAYGWHAIEGEVDQRMFQVASQYQAWHGLALFAVAWLADSRPSVFVTIAGCAFVVGILLFCGVLYAFSLSGSLLIAGAAPAGGVAFMAGWGAIIAAAFRRVD